MQVPLMHRRDWGVPTRALMKKIHNKKRFLNACGLSTYKRSEKKLEKKNRGAI